MKRNETAVCGFNTSREAGSRQHIQVYNYTEENEGYKIANKSASHFPDAPSPCTCIPGNAQALGIQWFWGERQNSLGGGQRRGPE